MMLSKVPKFRRLRVASRFAVVLLPALLAVGCSDDDSTPPPAATATPVPATVTATPPPATPTAAPNADLNAACEKLAGCDQCFANQYGRCLSTGDCAARLAADVAICINALAGCDQQALGDCLFLGCDGTDATGECG